MPGLYRDEGVVLRTIKLGEADRIVTFLTQGHGKVRAVAKGVRKTLEPLRRPARADEPVALQCYRGRELDVVTQAETLEANRALREEYALLTHAVPMLEAVDQVAPGARAEPRRSTACSPARCGRSRELRNPVVTPAFFWKLLSLEGFHPMLDDCARCGGRRTWRCRSDAREGWSRVRSRRRRHAVLGVARWRPAAVVPGARLLRRMLGGGLERRVWPTTPGPATHEVEHLGIRAVEHHVERRLRSTALL